MSRPVDLNGARIYIAGPMRYRPEFNFPAFHEAAGRLRAEGYSIVFNPAQRDEEDGFDPTGLTGNEDLDELGFDLNAARRRDLTFIASRATHIYLLPGWSRSSGAMLEWRVARDCGVTVIGAVK